MNRRGGFWLNLVSCFLIPAYTLLFAGSVEWFGTNFSVLAVTGPRHYRGFVLWGLLAGGYFLVMLWKISYTLSRPWVRWVLRLGALLGCLCLGGALLVPYLPDFFPKFAQLHILLAFTACVLVMLSLLWAIWHSSRGRMHRYRSLFWAWGGIVLCSGVIFLVGGMVTSALEVFFTISAAQLTRILWLYRQLDR